MIEFDTEIGTGKWLKSLIGLYGREKEHLAISNARHRVLNDVSPPELFCFSGMPGTGKSFLIRQEFEDHLSHRKQNQDIYFGAGKFDHLRRRQPYSAIQKALTQVCNRILSDHGPQEKNLISFLIDEHQEGNSRILCDLIPILTNVIAINISNKDEPEPSQTQHHDVQNQFLHVLRKLVRLICSMKPMVLSLDDLQNADQSSLDVIQSLLGDDTLHHFLIVGSIRSSDYDDDDGSLVSSWLQKLEASRVSTTIVEISNFSQKEVTSLILEKIPTTDCCVVEPIADLIFQTTLGNPYFIMKLIEHWIVDELIAFDFEKCQWKVEIDAIKSAEIPNTIEDLLVRHFQIQHQDVITLLQIGAMLGAYFDEYTISLVIRSGVCGSLTGRGPSEEKSSSAASVHHSYAFSEEQTIKQTLKEAVSKGFLVEDGKLGYNFIHDKVRQVAYSFVKDPNEKHLKIGRLLVKNGNQVVIERNVGSGRKFKILLGSISEDDLADFVERQLYVAVDQMNKGKDSGMKESEAATLVQLNVRASDLASESASFSSAKCYLDIAQDILQGIHVDPWSGKYNKLCLELTTKKAKTEYSLGNCKVAETCCDEVLQQESVTTLEKIQAYKIKFDLLAAQTKKEEALEICLSVLGEIGCSFPKNGSLCSMQARCCLKKTKSKYIPTEEQIRKMPFATDILKIEEMELIEKAGSFAYSLNMIDLYILTRCRWIQLMNKHGLTALSGSAVASFANILMHVYNDFVLGAELADLAMVIQQRINSKFTSTRTLNTASMNVLGWVRPLHTTLKYHLQAHENGLLSGNIEGAYVAILFSHWVRLYSGFPLTELDVDCRKHIPEMRRMGHNMYADLSCTIWQTVLNLVGSSENTYTLTGSAMDENEFMKKPFKHSMGLRKSFLYAFFGQHELGAKDALERGDSYTKAFVGAGYGLEPFYRGISLYAMARKTKSSKYKGPANKIRSQLKMWVQKGCVNLEGLLRLLDAEHAALCGKHKQALKNYEIAECIATRDGFSQNAALTSERHAEFLFEIKDEAAGREQMARAIKYYREWGAMRKVELLQEALDQMAWMQKCAFPVDTEATQSSGISCKTITSGNCVVKYHRSVFAIREDRRTTCQFNSCV